MSIDLGPKMDNQHIINLLPQFALSECQAASTKGSGKGGVQGRNGTCLKLGLEAGPIAA